MKLTLRSCIATIVFYAAESYLPQESPGDATARVSSFEGAGGSFEFGGRHSSPVTWEVAHTIPELKRATNGGAAILALSRSTAGRSGKGVRLATPRKPRPLALKDGDRELGYRPRLGKLAGLKSHAQSVRVCRRLRQSQRRAKPKEYLLLCRLPQGTDGNTNRLQLRQLSFQRQKGCCQLAFCRFHALTNPAVSFKQ